MVGTAYDVVTHATEGARFVHTCGSASCRSLGCEPSTMITYILRVREESDKKGILHSLVKTHCWNVPIDERLETGEPCAEQRAVEEHEK